MTQVLLCQRLGLSRQTKNFVLSELMECGVYECWSTGRRSFRLFKSD
ncbi:TPA: hypothetical protein I7727_07430 [Vibrio vulnificus]|nr:hypothetical protein [Vibrio vulnificus]